ncbi:hypothetical protein [Lactococcus petauri]|uniref:hypothetical protein n=1 Tax=Lactococcus petauri TaxID=1940789 RepID=UPI0031FE983C
MKFSTEYGYLIKALREYPFTEQVNKILLEIKYPVSKAGNDPNWWITPQNIQRDPQALVNIIKLETNGRLIKYRRYHQAITEMIAETDEAHWKIIKAVYIHNELTLEGALMRYSDVGKTQAYKKIIRPFFEKLETKIDEIAANERFELKIPYK